MNLSAYPTLNTDYQRVVRNYPTLNPTLNPTLRNENLTKNIWKNGKNLGTIYLLTEDKYRVILEKFSE